MDRLGREVIARLPLAEAVLLVWSHLADETFLSELFETHRGRCYQKILTFPVLVSLIAEALLEHGGSGRQSFERAAEEGQLQASIQAAYGKLGRLLPCLSAALRPREPPWLLGGCSRWKGDQEGRQTTQ